MNAIARQAGSGSIACRMPWSHPDRSGRMSDRLVILGSKGGPAIRPGGPSPTSSLLELGGRTIVVDCGLGVTRGIVDAGIPLKRLDIILITHLHSDHVLELGPLVHTPGRQASRPGPGVRAERDARPVESFCRSLEFDIEIRIVDEGRPDIRDLVRIAWSMTRARSSRDDRLTITALRVDHPPVRDAFALRVRGGSRDVVFSGDTTLFEPLADFARGADVLVHEAMLVEASRASPHAPATESRLVAHLLASHTRAEDAGRIAAEASVRHLVLNHLIPADDPAFGEAQWIEAARQSWSGPLTIGRDGLAIDFESLEAIMEET